MVESSKILTVSYGTFSCTLEGFEDSFSTMKAIAEYFRDLAAEDRYFGAEPPTPDVEMLSRIAEREIARRVEAHTSDTGIHLRATPEDDAPAMPPAATPPVALSIVPDAATEKATADANETESEGFGDEGAIEDLENEAAPEVTEAEDGAEEMATEEDSIDDGFEAFTPIAEAPAHPDPDSVASKLQRIQAVVGQTDALDDEDYADDSGSMVMADIADVTDEADEAIADVDADEAVAEEEAEEVVAETVADEAVAESERADAEDDIDVADITDVAFDDDEDDVAEDHVAFEAEADEMSEEEADETDAQISQVLRNLERAGATVAEDVAITPIEDVLEGPDAYVADGQSDEEEVAAFGDFDETLDSEHEDAHDTDDTLIEDEDLSEALEDFADATGRDDQASETDIAAEKMDSPEPFLAVDDLAAAMDDAENTATVEDDVAEEPVAAKPALRARILRVAKKVKTEAEPVEAEDPVAPPLADLDGAEELAELASVDDATLSADDEADLQAELNALTGEADLAELDDAEAPELDDIQSDHAEDDLPEVAEDADPAVENDAVAARAGRASLPDNDDAAMSRIMEQADEELSDPESSRRRAAIAQLKAAVAATEAARQLGDDDDPSASAEDAFREDLNEVVRPRRAPRPAKSTERSERPRPAPLKLVASQRVDVTDEAMAPSSPVRPRRIAVSEPAASTDAGSFAEFAEEMGATELPDLLEAAAAYTAYVEGENEFSRPQIMRKVQASSDEPFTREDGLRSFGTLLRQGRISKAGNGRFQVSDQTRFKPEQKAG